MPCHTTLRLDRCRSRARLAAQRRKSKPGCWLYGCMYGCMSDCMVSCSTFSTKLSMASIEARILTDKLASSFASFSRNLFILCCNSTILRERSASCCNAVYYPIKSIDSCFFHSCFLHTELVRFGVPWILGLLQSSRQRELAAGKRAEPCACAGALEPRT